MQELDLIVIGSGPGGEGAAMQAAKAGKRVVVVERYDQVGGGCTHWGTIPSKALRHAVQETTDFRRNRWLRDAARGLHLDFPALMRTAASVIADQVDMRQGFYDRNRVEVLQGDARFLDAHTVEVERPDDIPLLLRAPHVVIATGSRPYHPPDVDFSLPRVFDADTILKLDYTPQALIIYGAGVIGCEYASMFRNLDVKVNLVNMREKLLAFLDTEIIDALGYHLREQGIIIRHLEEYARVEQPDERTVVLHLQSGKQLKGDALLWANGRSGNTGGLGLENIGLEPDARDNLAVNESFQTEQPHIYAVGDVIGPPALASAAYDQGRFAARHLLGAAPDLSFARRIPTGIYTSPEISSLGLTERELTEQKVPYEVGHSAFKSLARAQITGNTVGILKLLFHRETLEVLGIHCFGYQAAEIIHIGQAVMSQPGAQNSLEYFVNTTFNYPTMAEAYRVAALNGLNRL
jgi:NAD(P) transhydrogenase